MSKLTEQQKSVWADHIQSQLQSGLSQQDYCKQEKLTPHCSWYWKRKFKPVTVEWLDFIGHTNSNTIN